MSPKSKTSVNARKEGILSLYHHEIHGLKGVPKIPSGIRGLDAVLLGGLPANRMTLLSGGPGTGKTALANEFLYQGAATYNEPGVFVTFEERPEDIIANVAGFGWDYNSLIKRNKLAFVDMSDCARDQVELNGNYDLSPILIRVRSAIERIGARRVVVDSMAALFSQLSASRQVRDIFNRLCHDLRNLNVTTVVTAERHEGAVFGDNIGEFVADGAIELKITPGQQRMVRQLVVRKMRGAGYRSGMVEFDIGANGVEVFPKIPIERRYAKTSFKELKKFGIAEFDEITGGGLPEGHIALISGNTGTGKTTFAMQFAKEGVESGESAVYLALEEPCSQLQKSAMEHGWKFQDAIHSELLTFIDVPLIDISTDQILFNLVDRVLKTNARRIVVDSISSLESATMSEESVRQFLIQLLEFCKSQGVTCLLIYLTTGVFGAVRGQLLGQMQTTDMRLSSVVDCLVLLRYVERGQKVKRLLNVLKMRGHDHSKAIYLYEIRKEGIWIGEKYEE